MNKKFFLLIIFSFSLILTFFVKRVYTQDNVKEENLYNLKILFEGSIYPYNPEEQKSLKLEEKDIPKGITIDHEGKLFVIFLHRKKIQVFDSKGHFRYEFGENGTGVGKYILPLDVESSSNGKIFILDSSQNKILIYNNRGGFIKEFSVNQGLLKGEKGVRASKIFFDRRSEILYISDSQNSEIRKFSSDGKYIGHFGGFGTEEGMFSFPGAMAADSRGNIYITDLTKAKVQVFGDDNKFKYSFGGYGNSPGRFIRPNAIVIDSKERVYVLDRLLSIIQVFDNEGKMLGVIKDLEEKDSLKNAAPFDLAIGNEDRIYISAQDYYSIKIIKYIE